MLNKCKFLCTALAIIVIAGPAMATIEVSIVPFTQDLDMTIPGATATIDIVADIPESDAIVGWGLDLSYNNLVIELLNGNWDDAVVIGPAFDEVGTVPDGDELAGLVPGACEDCLWGDDILLATVTFEPVALGVSPLTLSDSNPPDLTEGFALCPDLGGGFAEVLYYGGEIRVTPEPASLSLLALGLLAIRRR